MPDKCFVLISSQSTCQVFLFFTAVLGGSFQYGFKSFWNGIIFSQ